MYQQGTRFNKGGEIVAINYQIYEEMLKKATPEQLAKQQDWNKTYAPADTKLSDISTVRTKNNTDDIIQNPVPAKTAAELQTELINAQKAGQLSALEAAYQNSMGAFNQQKKLLPEQYRQQRIGVDTSMQQQNRKFSEFLAQRGLNASGAVAQGAISNNVAAQGATSQIRMEEMKAMEALRNQMLAAQTNYNADVAGVESGALADLTKYQIEDLKTKEAEDKQMALDTIGKYSQDYTQGIYDIRDDGDPSNDFMIPYLEAARADKVAGIEASKAESAIAEREYAMDVWKMTGVADSWVADTLGVPQGTRTSDYLFKAAQLDLDRQREARIASGGSGSGGSGGGSPSDEGMTYNQFESKVLLTAEKDPVAAMALLEQNQELVRDAKNYDTYIKLKARVQELIDKKNQTSSSNKLMQDNFGILDIFNKLY